MNGLRLVVFLFFLLWGTQLPQLIIIYYQEARAFVAQIDASEPGVSQNSQKYNWEEESYLSLAEMRTSVAEKQQRINKESLKEMEKKGWYQSQHVLSDYILKLDEATIARYSKLKGDIKTIERDDYFDLVLMLFDFDRPLLMTAARKVKFHFVDVGFEWNIIALAIAFIATLCFSLVWKTIGAILSPILQYLSMK